LSVRQPLHRPLLQHSQQFALQAWIERGNLIEKQRSVVRDSINPARALSAPVNAPFSHPKSSDSISDSGNAEQFKQIYGCPPRSPDCTIALAINSLPVPLSPRSTTVVLLSATA